jgi:hypothetical protein
MLARASRLRGAPLPVATCAINLRRLYRLRLYEREPAQQPDAVDSSGGVLAPAVSA